MTRLPAGLPRFLSPREGRAGRWTQTFPLPVQPPVGISASAEEDFELAGEFLDVFHRAGERVLGFCVGCLAIAAVWMIVSAL